MLHGKKSSHYQGESEIHAKIYTKIKELKIIENSLKQPKYFF